MPESPIRKLVSFVEKTVKKGKHSYYLNIDQPYIKIPIEAMNAVQNHKFRHSTL